MPVLDPGRAKLVRPDTAGKPEGRPTRRALIAAPLLAAPLSVLPSLTARFPGAVAETQGLGALAAACGIVFGTTLTRGQVEESPEMRRIVEADAGMVVPGLELKWAGHRPSPEGFDFRDADVMVRFAEEQRKALRGHALVWHEALPPWFAGAPTDAAGMRALLERHIRTVAGRYAGRMHSWDVVNEPVEPWYRRPDGLRDTPFLRALGPGYIDLAFRLAHEADPAARLVLNEYGLEMPTEDNAARRAAVLALLRGMRARGVPVHALGIQAHLSAANARSFDPSVLRNFIRDVAALGLEVYVTELDVTDRGLPPEIPARDAAVARCYRAFLDAVLAETAVRVVVVWGISDRYTWMNDSPNARREDGLPVRAHPYDQDFRPKPAWHAMADAFRAAPPR
ncbi:endo-1,4-beta-xylanase [Pararoseomonas indoligenes]|uniref:Beta-xylanase n=1 Tax=Roseomonas indoligenes TaxID=2820811 RepID=A0A940MRD4_9PROT|nr:endo-1,4-beta-xylanase [Pararoseomonas indoligenes]MBP0492633.1 endo-1,4-beta-xylanase [Pararoseomonas indoligenes]